MDVVTAMILESNLFCQVWFQHRLSTLKELSMHICSLQKMKTPSVANDDGSNKRNSPTGKVLLLSRLIPPE